MIVEEPSTLAIGYLDGAIQILDWKSDTMHYNLVAHQSNVACLAQHGKFLVSSSADTTTKIWNINTGELLKTLPTDRETSPSGLAWTDNYKKIVTASVQGHIQVWDVKTG
jgi:WD40 repeat protein